MRTFLLLLLAVFALCAVLDVVSARRQDKHVETRKPLQHVAVRGINSILEGTGPLLNPKSNRVIDFDLGHFFIYYGNSFKTGGADAAAPAIIKQFIADLSGSSYLNILPQYTGGPSKTAATNTIHWAGEVLAGTPYGLNVGFSKETCGFKFVERALSDKNLSIAFDPKVQYYMIFGSDVVFPAQPDDPNAQTICPDPSACGIHGQQNHTVNGVETQYLPGWVRAFAARPGACFRPYSQGVTIGPNANLYIQGILTTLVHEITESITDPDQDPSSKRAWQTAGDGQEIGDLCQVFGTIYESTTVTGAYYNVILGGHEYLIQGAWSNEENGCSFGKDVSSNASPAVLNSASVEETPSPSPRAFATLPSSGCITFGQPAKFRKIAKFSRICKNKLGGTVNVSLDSVDLCCNGISQFKPFSWSVVTPECDYGWAQRKQDALCAAIGGRTSCALGSGGAFRITCHH